MTPSLHAKHPKVTTPLDTVPGERPAFVLEGFKGTEALSQPFEFNVNLLAEKQQPVAFEKMLGQKITIKLPVAHSPERYITGIVTRLTQGREVIGHHHKTLYVRFKAEVRPKFWLLRHRVQSRIFQQKSVLDILQEVLQGLDTSFECQTEFDTRDYCVQYRESDFHFASRLMEEEGIYYYFKHTNQGHQMVLADTPESHVDLPGEPLVPFLEAGGAAQEKEGVYAWEKSQEIRPGKTTLWDYCFEMPEKNLEAQRTILETVRVGSVTHKLKVTGSDKLEVYEYPGGYARRYDGVAPGGGDRPSDLDKVFEDGRRTASVRMRQETVPGILVVGKSRCKHFSAGHKFTVHDQAKTHSNLNGTYTLTRVEHDANMEGGQVGEQAGTLFYGNTFHCIPHSLPYRPPHLTRRARIDGTQTAVVVGPEGEEIFTDKYGRVKVQFHWDRKGKKNADSSCWVRVGTLWAGQQWGAIHIPRVGQEVIVAFEDGDPDQPIIVGSVYNAKLMPPYTLPANKTQSGIKSRSSLKGGAEDFNELRFEDKKDNEDVYFHAQKDFHRVVENDDDLKVNHDQTIQIKNNRTETVQEGNEKVTVSKGNREVEISTGNEKLTVSKGNRQVEISTGNDTLTITMGNLTTKISAGKSETEAMQSIELKVGPSSIKIDPSGITLTAMTIKVDAEMYAEVKGLNVKVDGAGIIQLDGGLTMIN
jgi:type VI secretion system secreted protein VgrG